MFLKDVVRRIPEMKVSPNGIGYWVPGGCKIVILARGCGHFSEGQENYCQCQNHLLTFVCHILILALAVLFLWSDASTFINKSPPQIPDVILPEDIVLGVAAAVRTEIDKGLENNFCSVKGLATLRDDLVDKGELDGRFLLEEFFRGSFDILDALELTHEIFNNCIWVQPLFRVRCKVYEFSKLLSNTIEYELVLHEFIWILASEREKLVFGLYIYSKLDRVAKYKFTILCRFEIYIFLMKFMCIKDLVMRMFNIIYKNF
uniref:Reticulon domain-containing protein n=1 Tax=Solanum lycopersicum TaxID=4081 RepID=A0A3Q7FQT5_SOLLC